MELYLEQWDFWHDRNPNGNTNKVCYCKETQLNVEDLLRHACLCYYTVFVLSSNHKGFVFLLFYIQRLHAYVRRTCLPCYLFTVCVCVFSGDHKAFLSVLAAVSLVLIFLLVQRHCSLVSKIALALGLLGVYSYRAAVGNVLFPWQHSSRAVSK